MRETFQPRVRGEVEKRDDAIQFIHRITSMINSERQKLGLPGSFDFEPESAYALEPSVLPRGVKGYNQRDNGKYAFAAGGENFDTAITMFEEQLHLAGYRPDATRAGYSFTGLQSKNIGATLDEGVVSSMVIEILFENRQALKRFFPNEEVSKRVIQEYHSYERHILKPIVAGIAEYRAGKKGDIQAAYQQTWNDIKRGHFNGDYRWFRDFEKVFGKKSLVILMNAHELLFRYYAEDLKPLLVELFSTKDATRRDLLVKKLLVSEHTWKEDRQRIWNAMAPEFKSSGWRSLLRNYKSS